MSKVHYAASGSVPTELVARLENASAGSRELDAEIACIFPETLGIREVGDCSDFKPCRSGVILYSREGQAGYSTSAAAIKPFTTSLDAALALAERVLPGWFKGLQQNEIDGGEHWTAWIESPDGDQSPQCHAHTPAVALCLAILKATPAASAPPVGMEDREAGRNAPEHETGRE